MQGVAKQRRMQEKKDQGKDFGALYVDMIFGLTRNSAAAMSHVATAHRAGTVYAHLRRPVVGNDRHLRQLARSRRSPRVTLS